LPEVYGPKEAAALAAGTHAKAKYPAWYNADSFRLVVDLPIQELDR
jgi:hypothetical protein